MARIREERSLRHVAMVSKFMDGNEPKTSLTENLGEIVWGLIRKVAVPLSPCY